MDSFNQFVANWKEDPPLMLIITLIVLCIYALVAASFAFFFAFSLAYWLSEFGITLC
ncbi:hypothetical protein SAMN05660691_02441 [Rheinheimera pacifica]|uniref:Uncharacterized protein n=1 Tax=Rheinheimera pacifica TaxID=173990 RepID=A0A1H6M552_9GAMM|nr:hypothetical protein [Rheinheimera pacifica]SEH96461.1 hypothetical protein SAMN05660691_02441 [Rheinheimera pacifica]